MGHFIYGWRQVPVDIAALGEKAMATRPEIEQIMFLCQELSEQEAERQLYLIRRIEKAFWLNWLLIFISVLCQRARSSIKGCSWLSR